MTLVKKPAQCWCSMVSGGSGTYVSLTYCKLRLGFAPHPACEALLPSNKERARIGT